MPKTRPSMDPDAREKQIIAAAVDLAERQILEGTASSQVITHFLKLGSTKERLEKEKLEEENKLLRAKTEALKSAKKQEELFEEVKRALRRYNGQFDEDDEGYDD